MARSLNKVELIGNITKDAELRDTNSGNKYCLFTVATNRSWKTDGGNKHDEAEYHQVICWDKLAEIVSQFGQKGKKLFVEGRLSTRKFINKDNQERSITEIIASDVIFLDKKEKGGDNNGYINTD